MIAAEILTQIPGCSVDRAPLDVQPLPGGRGCNRVLRVDTPDGRFVLRQRQPPLDRPGSWARTELLSQRAAAAAGIAPPVLAAAPDGSWLLMEYIDAPLWTESMLLSREGIEQLGAQLASLHELPVPDGVPAFDAVAVATGYVQQLRERAAPESGWEPQLSRVRELSLAIAGIDAKPVLNHGDLQLGNMLGPGPCLIDWEYAQAVDPTYDCACLLTYYPQLEGHLGHLLACAGLGSIAERTVLALQRQRFACLDQLWGAVNRSKAG